MEMSQKRFIFGLSNEIGMGKCLNCGSDIINIEGRREKMFCSNKGKCRGEYWRERNPKNPKYVNIKTHTAEVERLKKKSERLEMELELERQNRSNPLINAARGRDESGINEDEVKGSRAIYNALNEQPKSKAYLDMMEKIEAERQKILNAKNK